MAQLNTIKDVREYLTDLETEVTLDPTDGGLYTVQYAEGVLALISNLLTLLPEELCEICKEPREESNGKFCNRCRDDYKESDTK